MSDMLSSDEVRVLQALSTQAQPMEPQAFWTLVERGPEAALGLEERARAMSTLRRYVEPLAERIELWEAEHGQELSSDGDTHGLAEAVIARGREAYERALADPERAAPQDEAEPTLAVRFDLYAPFREDRTRDLWEILRACGVARPLGDPGGLADHELVLHPERGLGIARVETGWRDLWLFFEGGALQYVRSSALVRRVALYRDDPLGARYRSVSLCGGDPYEVLECRGEVGSPYGQRFWGPLPRAEAEAIVEVRLAAHRAEGYAERELPFRRLVAELRGAGLREERNQPLCSQLIQELPDMLAERGNGRMSGFRVRLDRTLLDFAVYDEGAAAWGIWHWAERLGCVEQDLQVVALDGDGPWQLAPRRSAAVDPTALPRAVDDRDSSPSQRYFARLSFAPSAERTEEAAERAREASEDPALDGTMASLAALEARLSALRDLPPEERRRLQSLYAAYAGELLRREADGEWAAALLFGALSGQVAVLLGPSRLPWFAHKELGEWLEARRGGTLSSRCRELLERARAERPSRRPAGGLYPLAAGEGRFHAGITADGRQALLGAFHGDSGFGLFFDPEGRLLEYVSRQGGGLEGWQRELGFVPRTVRVRRFSIPGVELGIEDLSWHLAEVLDDPGSEPDESRREELLRSARAWMESGEFVLYWGNDLFVDARGHVTSS